MSRSSKAALVKNLENTLCFAVGVFYLWGPIQEHLRFLSF